MEGENSSDDFNRTQCSRSRFPSQSPPAENLSDTHPSRSRSRSPSPSPSSSSSSDDDEDYQNCGVYDADDHALCRHGTSKEELEVFDEYFKQNYEVNFYPGSCQYVRCFPCDVEKEFELLNDASRKCITEYNKNHSEEPDYELLDVLMATKRPCAGYNYYITFRARARAPQVGLPDDMVKTFRAEYYYCVFKGNYGKVSHCEPKDEFVERMRRCKLGK